MKSNYVTIQAMYTPIQGGEDSGLREQQLGTCWGIIDADRHIEGLVHPMRPVAHAPHPLLLQALEKASGRNLTQSEAVRGLQHCSRED